MRVPLPALPLGAKSHGPSKKSQVFQKAMVKTVEDALERAGKIGFPIMVKAWIIGTSTTNALSKKGMMFRRSLPGEGLDFIRVTAQERMLE